MNCPTCGAPVDYLDEQVLRRGAQEMRTNRSYHYQQPPPVDLKEIRLEAIERFVQLVNRDAEMAHDAQFDIKTPHQLSMESLLETMRGDVRGWVRMRRA